MQLLVFDTDTHASHLEIAKRRGGESCGQESRKDIFMSSLMIKAILTPPTSSHGSCEP